MKRILLTLGLPVLIILVSETTEAKPKKMQLGYWVVRDHVDGRNDATVSFYNTSDSLVFKQNLGKRKVELSRKNIKKLNKELKSFHKHQQDNEKFMITKL